MPGIVEHSGPLYISSNSADVILSDTRPIKLTIEALRSINVLLDEFLYSILSTARSLHTDRLRSSLLNLLPTSLGKEALLEAEVELRAYWGRTNPDKAPLSSAQDDDSKTFSLEWSFELLRVKCEAYSTLNESDEDSVAEARLFERMSQIGGLSPPKESLVPPAALYLTAILEAMCEHILTNVARVAARDSSRSAAVVQDLYVALCEDESIYASFKSMKVYEQIEQLSNPAAGKPRRSKSLRSEKSTPLSPHQDISMSKDQSISRSRLSFDAPSMTAVGLSASNTSTPSRTSLERARSVKRFLTGGTRNSGEDSHNGHRRAESTRSTDTRATSVGHGYGDADEVSYADSLQQEFDDLMRSDSTMRVSLTPDRLKTMEVYKQEKDQRTPRRPVPSSSDSESIHRGGAPKSALYQVDSILEDEEEQPIPIRARQASVSAILTTTTTDTAPPINRARSASVGAKLIKKPSVRPTIPVPALPKSQIPSSDRSESLSTTMPPSHTVKSSHPPGLPPRTRKLQRNRESLDLDEIMGGSGDEQQPGEAQKPKRPPSKSLRDYKVSASTRELIDFLSEGPPLDLMRPSNNVSTGSIDSALNSPMGMGNGKPKASGRLQRMMSKLALGGSDKPRGSSSSEDVRSGKNGQHHANQRAPTSKATNESVPSASPLANRPVLPRPPLFLATSQGSTEGNSTDIFANGVRSRFLSVTQPGHDVVNGSPRTTPGVTPISTISTGSVWVSSEDRAGYLNKLSDKENALQINPPGNQQRRVGGNEAADTGAHIKANLSVNASILRKQEQQAATDGSSYSPTGAARAFIAGASAKPLQLATAATVNDAAVPPQVPAKPIPASLASPTQSQTSSTDNQPDAARTSSPPQSPVRLSTRKPVPSLLPLSHTPPTSPSQTSSTIDANTTKSTAVQTSDLASTAATTPDVAVAALSSPAAVSHPHINQEAALEMKHLFSRASNADECRVILEMFMARAGMPLASALDKSSTNPKVGNMVTAERNEGHKPSGPLGAKVKEVSSSGPAVSNSVFAPGKFIPHVQEDMDALECSLVDALLGGYSAEKSSQIADTNSQEHPQSPPSSISASPTVSMSSDPASLSIDSYPSTRPPAEKADDT